MEDSVFRWRERAKSVTVIVLPAFIVGASLGLLSGWLTGLSGSDNVIAAAIPAILSVVGGFIFAKSASNGNGPLVVQTTVFVVVFCLAFYLALLHGNEQKKDAALQNRANANRLAQKELAKAYDAHLKHLQECLEAQMLMNIAREEYGQGPLGPEYFCRQAPITP